MGFQYKSPSSNLATAPTGPTHARLSSSYMEKEGKTSALRGELYRIALAAESYVPLIYQIVGNTSYDTCIALASVMDMHISSVY